MDATLRRVRCRAAGRCFGLALALAAAGCGSHVQNRNLVALAGTAALGHFPTSQLGQTYYLGVFDPSEQTPPTIYRIRVQAQSSALGPTKFASGWVPAALIDSLSAVETPERADRQAAQSTAGVAGSMQGFLRGRRHVVFGPEGYREVPRDHRLVVVMGANPSAFFNGIDQALGVVAEATQGTQAQPELLRRLSAEHVQLTNQSRSMEDLLKNPLRTEGAKP